MTAAEAVILVVGSLVLLTAMMALMIRANNRETRIMQRRREEWEASHRGYRANWADRLNP